MLAAVTGAGGHLGGVVVRGLIEAGYDVRAIDLKRSETLEGLDIEFVRADVLNHGDIASALASVDVVCHLAALISVVGDATGMVTRVNGDGPGIVADAALEAGVRRMVHCSSVHAFDLAAATEPLTEAGVRSVSTKLPAYDRSKWLGERAVQERVQRGLDAVIVNPTGIIGPYDFVPSRMGQVFLAIASRKLPATIDGGFDWVDVRDVASGIVAAIDNGATGSNYLLSGQRVSIPDLASVAARLSGVDPPRFTIPAWLARMWGPIGTILARRSNSALAMTSESLHALFNGPTISSAQAETDLGYQARPFEESVADIYDWFAGT